MPRATWCSEEIYEAALAVRDRCLRRDGSLLSPEREIWTVAGLEAVIAVIRDDIGTGSWGDKLVVQVESLSPVEIQLAAELVYVLLLPQADTHAPKKREHLKRILALLPGDLSIPQRLDGALEGGGVANFSTGKNWSPQLVQFLARLAIELKQLGESERDKALEDPWRFRAVVDRASTRTDGMMANAIKHLLFPDAFDYMISPDQRRRLVKAFADAPGVSDTTDEDRQIARVRELIGEDMGEGFDFYDEAVKRIWSGDPDPRWATAVRFAAKLYAREDFDREEREYKLAIAKELSQARTSLRDGSEDWLAPLEAAFENSRNNLVDWRTRGPFLDWTRANRDQAADALRALWLTEDVRASAPHEFIHTLPADALRGGVGTRTSVMSFLLMGVDATQLPFFRPTVLGQLRKALGVAPSRDADIGPETAHRPEDLASRLGLDGRRVRAFLREAFPRAQAEKGQSWYLTTEQSEAVIERFGPETDTAAGDALYAEWVSLLEELRLRMLAAGTRLRDLLDAQGLAWWLVHGRVPSEWTKEEQEELEAFRRGPSAPSEPAPSEPPPTKQSRTASEAEAKLPDGMSAELASALHMPMEWLDERLAMLEKKKQMVLYGPPGTGKTFLATHIGELIEQHGGTRRVIQFHPSYTYEDFFEGYRPRPESDGTLSFELVPGALREMAEAARAEPEKPHVLIIDEINRGNISKIFGELYFLLEYREKSIRLQYSRSSEFSLPENLLLVGTMNTADRSIALIDEALRRRFYFVGLHPTEKPVDAVLDGWLSANGLDPEPAHVLRALNEAIGDSGAPIGPSYFITADGSQPDLEEVWRYSIMPTLEERYYDTSGDLRRFSLASLRERASADETARSVTPALDGDDADDRA